jgi:cytoskeletal protein RodZ
VPKQRVRTQHNNKGKFRIAIPLLVIILAFGVTWTTHTWPFRTSANDPDSHRNITSNTSPKNNNPSGKDTTTSPTGDQTSNQVPVSKTLSAAITQLTEVNNTVKFTATVQNADSAGTCVVTFSNPNDRPVTQQATATNADGVSTCGPISIPANEFSYLGQWNVDFHYYVGDQQATTSSVITIQ